MPKKSTPKAKSKFVSYFKYFFGIPNALRSHTTIATSSSGPPIIPGQTAPPAPAASAAVHKKQKRGHPHIFDDVNDYFNGHMSFLNNSKIFAGLVMILLNVGSKFIQIQFSKSMEEYMKMTITKEILVFAMAWMGTRDVFSAVCLTSVFIVLSEFLFNEDSAYCVIPHHHRILPKFKDGQANDLVTEEEISNALQILEKLKKEKYKHKMDKYHGRAKEMVVETSTPISIETPEFTMVDGFHKKDGTTELWNLMNMEQMTNRHSANILGENKRDNKISPVLFSYNGDFAA